MGGRGDLEGGGGGGDMAWRRVGAGSGWLLHGDCFGHQQQTCALGGGCTSLLVMYMYYMQCRAQLPYPHCWHHQVLLICCKLACLCVCRCRSRARPSVLSPCLPAACLRWFCDGPGADSALVFAPILAYLQNRVRAAAQVNRGEGGGLRGGGQGRGQKQARGWGSRG